MSYNNFGPAYRTTRADRIARRECRNRVGVGEMSDPPPSNRNMQGARAPIVDSLRNVSTPLPPPLLPTPLLPHTPPPVHELIDLTASDHLMDLDNTLLEAYVTRDEVGTVNLRQSIPFLDEAVGYGNTTEYFPIDPRSFRRTTTFADPCFTGHDFRNRERNAMRQYGPDEQLGQVRVLQPSNILAKTDRIVVLELLKNVRPTSGADERELVEFLKQLRPVFEIDPLNSNEIIKLLLPKVSGQLFNLWMRAISSNVSWENLHIGILNQFLTPMRLRELQLLVVERPQRFNELFIDYVEDCVMSAFALRVGLSEADMIESVLSRCLPETRHHFTFGSKPRTLEELITLAGQVTNTMKADARYFGRNREYPMNNNVFQNNPAQSRTVTHPPTLFQQPQYGPNSRGSNIRCHRCGGSGHIARNCRSNLN